MKYILFPLGNIGDKYSKTRHNVARFVFGLLKKEEGFNNLLQKEDIKIFIPDCYMNESGKYLKDYLKNTNIEKDDIIVMYDDKDLEIGNIKLSINKSDGGHNGLKDIIEKLNTKNFYRIRIGIAPKGTGKDGLIPPHGDIVREYVLGNLSFEEREILSQKEFLERIIVFLEKIILEISEKEKEE